MHRVRANFTIVDDKPKTRTVHNISDHCKKVTGAKFAMLTNREKRRSTLVELILSPTDTNCPNKTLSDHWLSDLVI